MRTFNTSRAVGTAVRIAGGALAVLGVLLAGSSVVEAIDGRLADHAYTIQLEADEKAQKDAERVIELEVTKRLELCRSALRLADNAIWQYSSHLAEARENGFPAGELAKAYADLEAGGYASYVEARDECTVTDEEAAR